VRVTMDCGGTESSKPACSLGETRIGKGEAFVVGSNFSEVGGGFVEGTTLYVTAKNGIENQYEDCKTFCSIAAVYKVDLLTGNRSIVSGYYQDPRSGVKVTGAGPYWGPAASVLRGSDGSLYVYTSGTDHRVPHKIFKLAANGDRTEVWDSGNKPCTGLEGPGFNIDLGIAAGSGNMFYLVGNDHNSNAAAAKLDITTGKCTVFSVTGDKNLGSGAGGASILKGPSVYGNKLYAVAYNDLVMSINTQTGAREIVTKASGGGMFGSGPKPGKEWTFAVSDGVWTTGNQDRKPVKVDAQGDREEIDAQGFVTNLQLIPYGVTANKIFVGGAQNAVVLVDIASGKSQIISR
jgi:hypothetical protein